jgi:Leucine rich repeat
VVNSKVYPFLLSGSFVFFVILSILSQNGAFGEPCDWTKYKKTVTEININECESPKFNPVFLRSESLITLVLCVSLTVVEDKSFIRAPNLQTLDLSRNKIERVDKNAFIGLQKLTTLFLHGNKIQSLYLTVFVHLPKLQYLKLQYNSLTSFDFSIVKHNHQLNTLYISSNAITNVTTSQQYSSKLTVIGMSENSLTSLSMENLPDCPKLQGLGISNNKLTKIDFESVKCKFPKLRYFYFGKNQFDCCFLVDMVRAMLLHMPKLRMDTDIIKNVNDTEALQRLNHCAKCVKPHQSQEKSDKLEVIIGNLTDANRTLKEEIQKLYIIGAAFAIVIIVIILAAVGISYFCCSRKPEEPEPIEIELREAPSDTESD